MALPGVKLLLLFLIIHVQPILGHFICGFCGCGLIRYNLCFPPVEVPLPPPPPPIPLLYVKVKATVTHALGEVEIIQTYSNDESKPIEAIYMFPLDSLAGVFYFTAEIDGHLLIAKSKPREEARAEYERAIDNQQTAVLGSELSGDIFQIRVGYLPPGSRAVITLRYVTEVKNDQGSSASRFFLPTTVAPRYITPSLASNDKAQEVMDNYRVSHGSPADLEIKVHVMTKGTITRLSSPSHSIVVAQKDEPWKHEGWRYSFVTLAGHVTDMDRDFILLINSDGSKGPFLFYEHLRGTAYPTVAAMVQFFPSFKVDEQRTELIFVVDRSGSMTGPSIALAKRALLFLLHSIPVDCYFNVIGFGSRFAFLFPGGSVKNTDATFERAIDYANRMNADMGGTEIYKPLDAIYNQPPKDPEYFRQIFVLTDGEVMDTERVLGLVRRNVNSARVFSLGIGDAASHYLVEGIAAGGGGTSAFASYNEPFEKKVLLQLKTALQPSLCDVKVTWEGVSDIPVNMDDTPIRAYEGAKKPVVKEKTLMGYGKASRSSDEVEDYYRPSRPLKPVGLKKPYLPFNQAPERIPPIIDGKQFVAFGIFRNGQVPTGATITAKSPDGPLSIHVQLTGDNELDSPTSPLHRLSAVKIIKELEADDTEGGEAAIYTKERITELAIDNGLASKYTSFIAVDERVNVNYYYNPMVTRRVPSQIAHGYGGHGSRYHRKPVAVGYQTQPAMLSMSGQQPMAFKGANANRMDAAGGAGGAAGLPMAMADAEMNSAAAAPMERQEARVSEKLRGASMSKASKDEAGGQSVLMKLISLQSFKGSWELTEDLCTIIKVSIEKIEEGVKSHSNWTTEAAATGLVLNYFEIKLPGEKDAWELVKKKGLAWLESNHGEVAKEVLKETAAWIKN